MSQKYYRLAVDRRPAPPDANGREWKLKAGGSRSASSRLLAPPLAPLLAPSFAASLLHVRPQLRPLCTKELGSGGRNSFTKFWLDAV
jgi:hypothetical protein